VKSKGLSAGDRLHIFCPKCGSNRWASELIGATEGNYLKLTCSSCNNSIKFGVGNRGNK
jgi:hypothetical protein